MENFLQYLFLHFYFNASCNLIFHRDIYSLIWQWCSMNEVYPRVDSFWRNIKKLNKKEHFLMKDCIKLDKTKNYSASYSNIYCLDFAFDKFSLIQIWFSFVSCTKQLSREYLVLLYRARSLCILNYMTALSYLLYI